jgi:hypothetical protein
MLDRLTEVYYKPCPISYNCLFLKRLNPDSSG